MPPTPKNVNAAIMERTIRHQVYLSHLAEGEASAVAALLRRAQDQVAGMLDKRLARIIDRGSDRGPETTKRLQQLDEAFTQIMRDWGNETVAKVRGDLTDLTRQEVQFNSDLVKEVVPVKVEMVLPDPQRLRDIVNSEVMDGATLRQWYGKMSFDTAADLSRAVRVGMTNGLTIQQLTQQIRGTRANKYQDGLIVQKRKREAETIARTAVNQVANDSRKAWIDSNKGIIKGEQWVSTLDTKTCLVCAGLDGTKWKAGSEHVHPLAHPNCRCTLIPWLKSAKELGLNIGEMPASFRDSMSGNVPDSMSYGDWLKTQPADVQDRALGKGRGKLFRAGKVQVREFTTNGRTLTLEQLAQLEKRQPPPPPAAKASTAAVGRISKAEQRRRERLDIFANPNIPIRDRLAVYDKGAQRAKQVAATISLDDTAAWKATEARVSELFDERLALLKQQNVYSWREMSEEQQAAWKAIGEEVEAIREAQHRMREDARTATANLFVRDASYSLDQARVDFNSGLANHRVAALPYDVQEGEAAKALHWFTQRAPEVRKLGGLEFKAVGINEEARAYCSDWIENERRGMPGATVAFTRDCKTTADTFAHELGHYISAVKPEVGRLAREFRDARCGNEPIKVFADMWPNAGYRSYEQGKRDKFDKLWEALVGLGKPGAKRHGYYTGKVYSPGHNAEEIVSMGLQALYTDPAKFAKVDPEYFKFIVAILEGDL